MKILKRTTILSGIATLLLSFAPARGQGRESVPIQKMQGVVDANGDGICDVTGRAIGVGGGWRQGIQSALGHRSGPGDGTGNQGQQPKDGTGYGARSGRMNGPQDCTQPRIGQGNRPVTGVPAGKRARKSGRP